MATLIKHKALVTMVLDLECKLSIEIEKKLKIAPKLQ